MSKQIPKYLLVLMLLSIAPSAAFSQVALTDYQRADSVIKLNDIVYHQINSVNWIDASSSFWYQVKTRDGAVFTLVDAGKMTRKSAFDLEKLVKQLNKQSDVKTTEKSVQLQKLKFDLKANLIHFEFGNSVWTCNLKNYALSKDSAIKAETQHPYWNDQNDELGNKPVTSPDSIWVAFIKNYNVYLRNAKDKKEFQLSFDGSSGDFYSSYFSWSPDSKKRAVKTVSKSEDHFIYFIE